MKPIRHKYNEKQIWQSVARCKHCGTTQFVIYTKTMGCPFCGVAGSFDEVFEHVRNK